ncbi:MAG: nickel insertion protein, partial [Clostridium sp.]|nr:nickel insertion protein [Clostridium sp.]
KEIVFEETTSIGIREYKVKRTKLNRKFQGVDTIYGEVKIKKSYYKDKLVNLKPEYDDCKKLAKDNCVSINSVYNEVYRNIEEEAKDE